MEYGSAGKADHSRTEKCGVGRAGRRKAGEAQDTGRGSTGKEHG